MTTTGRYACECEACAEEICTVEAVEEIARLNAKLDKATAALESIALMSCGYHSGGSEAPMIAEAALEEMKA